MTDVDPARAQRRKAAVVDGVFFLAALAAGALWVMERDDHRTTSGQIDSARTEVEADKAKAAELEPSSGT